MNPLSQFANDKILTHFAIALGGSLIVLAALFYASSNAGHDINPLRLMEVIKSSSIGFFFLYAVTTLLGLLIRAWRYRVLLVASGEQRVPGFKDMTLITAVRNMTVDLLPARLGELVFVALLRRQAGTQISSGLSALLFATLMDVLILAPFTIGIGLMVGFPNKQPFLLALIALAVVLGFLFGLKFVLPFFNKLIKRLATHQNKIISGLFKFIVSIDEAIEATMSAGIFGRVVSLTFLIRMLKYAGLLCLFYGLTRQNFPSLAEMNALKVLGALIASEMTASLPVPALMSFGTWELGGMTLLAYFGAIPQNALLTMLGVHVQTQAMDYGIGVAALAALLLVGGAKLHRPSGRNIQRWWIGLIFAIIAAVLAWLGFETSREKNAEYATTKVGEVVRPENAPIPAWIKPEKGFVVWSSNRAGNHDIWLMEIPTMRLRQLTNDPHTENFARISPDGKKVVFARSHQLWQSLRDPGPWDVWMIDIASGKEQLIAKWGMSPSWSADGRSITYQRTPGRIMIYDLQTGQERVYYQSGKDAFMRAPVDLLTPSIGQDQRMAFTFRDHGRPTNVIRNQNGEFEVVHHDSCQVMWAPSGDFVTYVQKGGKQVNQIMRFDPDTKQKVTLVDLPGDLSHEYFPRLSKNEQFMVFAASGGGHEHDLADYELFLWPVGSDSAEAMRLTFSEANDSWPDIWLAPADA